MTDLNTKTPNGWTEWGRHVLKTLEDQQDDIKEINNILTDVRIELRELKTKVTVRATALGAAVPTIAYILMKLIEQV